MKIFLSHSSRYKPLVRELKNHLPEHITSWLDENDLLVGDHIERGLKDAIETASDFVLIFLDQSAVESPWVKKELEWALQHEGKIGRTFILPIVLDPEAWKQVQPADFQNRKFLKLDDFSEDAIRALANSLIAQLFAMLSRDVALAKNAQPLSSSRNLLDDADRYLVEVANEIRFIANSYDRTNPLPLPKLFDVLSAREELGLVTEQRFHQLLVRLRQQGYLSGLAFLGDSIFVEEEHYGWKSTLFTDAKRVIARKASTLIRSGSKVVLDAGSTTIEIARHISRGIKMSFLQDLTVVTNSITAANELLTTVSEMGLEDDNRVLQVFLPGGRIRSNTLAIVGDDHIGTLDMASILHSLGGTDIAFVGTNGVYWDLGFMTHDLTETHSKAAMLDSAKQKIIVTHPSKFGIRQDNSFANFNQGIEIITCQGGDEETFKKYEHLLSATSTKITYAE